MEIIISFDQLTMLLLVQIKIPLASLLCKIMFLACVLMAAETPRVLFLFCKAIKQCMNVWTKVTYFWGDTFNFSTDIVVKFCIILKILESSCFSILPVHCEVLTSIGAEATEHVKRSTLCKLRFINWSWFFSLKLCHNSIWTRFHNK